MGIQIGNRNKIKNSNIAERINGVPVTEMKRKGFMTSIRGLLAL